MARTCVPGILVCTSKYVVCVCPDMYVCVGYPLSDVWLLLFLSSPLASSFLSPRSPPSWSTLTLSVPPMSIHLGVFFFLYLKNKGGGKKLTKKSASVQQYALLAYVRFQYYY